MSIEFINRMSSQLENFKWVSNEKCQFRCPICGDGKDGANKARGGFIKHPDGEWGYHCFNCGASPPFGKFLKDFDSDLYREYLAEQFLHKKTNSINLNADKTSKDESDQQRILQREDGISLFESLSKMSELPSDHEAIQYVKGRKIPKKYYSRMLYSEDFNKFVLEKIGHKVSTKVHPGIVFPLVYKYGEEFGVQCRYLDDSYLRYKIIVFDKQFPKVWGLDKINHDGIIHVTEGIFDAMFLPNSIAVLDSALYQRVDQLIGYDKSQFRLWYDNQPENHQVMKQKEEAILDGYSVAFYPPEMIHIGKDINEVRQELSAKDTAALLKRVEFLSGPKALAKHKLGK